MLNPEDWEEVPCNICGSKETSLAFSSRDRLFGSEDIFSVVQCQKCGLAYTHPRPKKKIMAKFYPSRYFIPGKSHISHTIGEKIKWRIKILVAKCHYGYGEIWGSSVITAIMRAMTGRWKKSLSFLPPHMGPGKILDVGCGGGDYLALLKRFGWDVYGVDTSPHAQQIAQGKRIPVFVGELEGVQFPESSFDIVHFGQSLEHMHDPAAAIRESYRVLKKPGGLLLADVPNYTSAWQNIFGSPWHILDLPRHLYHFSPLTLSLLVEKNGFVVRSLETLPFSCGIMNYFNTAKGYVEFFTTCFSPAEKRLLRNSIIFGKISAKIGAGDNIYLVAEALP